MRPAWLLGPLLLAGCTIPGTEDTPELDVQVPDAWAAAPDETAARDTAVWWDAFGDEDLAALVDEALLFNRDLVASSTRVEGAAAQARIAGADLFPTVDASGAVNRSQQVFVGLPIPGTGGVSQALATSYGVSLDVSWELDLWKRIAAGRDAAGEELVATAADYQAARLSIAAQVSKGWFALQEARLQQELTERTLASLERSTTIVRRRYEAGRATTLDLHRAQGDLAGARALMAVRNEVSERTVRQLELLLGRYPEGVLEREARLPDLAPTPAAGLPADLLDRRPDLIAAGARLRAADHRLYEARASLYPRLALSGSIGRTSGEIDDLVDSNFDTWSLAANLVQPLFQGGRLRANVDLNDARLREVAALYAGSALQAFSEVEVALAVEDDLAERERHLETASPRLRPVARAGPRPLLVRPQRPDHPARCPASLARRRQRAPRRPARAPAEPDRPAPRPRWGIRGRTARRNDGSGSRVLPGDRGMKKVLRVALPLAVLALGVLGARGLVAMRPEVEPVTSEIPRPVVEVVRAHAEAVELSIRAQGTVVPRTESQLVTEVSGRVLEVSPHWVNGGFFEAGEVLLRIDETDYRVALREAELRVAQAERLLAQERVDAEIARQDWISERGEEEPPELVVREPQLAEAKATVAAAESALDRAQRDVERCTVIAPYPGRVRSKAVDLGEFVTRGVALGTVYAVDYAEVRLPLPDSELAFVDLPLSYRGEDNGPVGPEVTLVARFAGEEYEWSGRIVRTEAELDPRSRMVVAVVRVPDPYGRSEVLDRPPLAIGMFVEALIAGRTIPDAIALPRTALRSGNRVFLVDGEDRLRIAEVEVLRTERDRVLLGGGIDPQAQVVVSPLEEAVDGARVRTLDASEGSER